MITSGKISEVIVFDVVVSGAVDIVVSGVLVKGLVGFIAVLEVGS